MAPRSKKDGLYEITLLRHGESTGNIEGRVQGRSDYPLTERGLQQARALARHWQAEKVSFDKIISSPSQRARKTAEIIAEALSLPVKLDPAWMERGFGEWEGLVLEEILQIKPDIDFFHPQDHPGESGENMLELYERASGCLERLLEHPAGRYLVVAHGAILNMALYAILGLGSQGNFQRLRFHIGNTAYSRLSYDPARGQWRVYSINNQAHLNGQRSGDKHGK